MNPNQSVEIQLVSTNEGSAIRAENVLIEMHFFIKKQFRYAFNVGKTTLAGGLTITYSMVEELRQRGAKFNLMDYNDALDRCDPSVAIVLLSERELRERLDYVVKVFNKTPDWAELWPSNSRVKAQPMSVELRGKVTHVRIPCEVVERFEDGAG